MSGPVRPPLTVETLDGTTVGRPITTIKVTNGDLTVSGNVATIDTSGGGGAMTSFDVAGDAGATQTVGNGDTLTLQGSGGITKVTMSATDTATISLENTAVTPGSYTLASITVDAQGRITAASSGSVSVPSGANPTATVSGTAVNGTAGTFMRSDAAPALADTAVTPGSYTNASLTVDAQGRLTAASSGAGGASEIPNSLGSSMTGTYPPSEHLGVGYNGTNWNNAPLNTSWANGLTRIRPHVMQQSGTLSKVVLWVAALPTGGSDQDFEIGLWNAGTNNIAGTLKCTAPVTVAEAGSTGIVTGEWAAEAGEDLTIAIGEVYWVGFFGTYGSSAAATQLYFFGGSDMSSYPARRTNNSTASTSDMGRFYPTTSGSPSTVGENPTINNADAASAQWPIMWYQLA